MGGQRCILSLQWHLHHSRFERDALVMFLGGDSGHVILPTWDATCVQEAFNQDPSSPAVCSFFVLAPIVPTARLFTTVTKQLLRT